MILFLAFSSDNNITLSRSNSTSSFEVVDFTDHLSEPVLPPIITEAPPTMIDQTTQADHTAPKIMIDQATQTDPKVDRWHGRLFNQSFWAGIKSLFLFVTIE